WDVVVIGAGAAGLLAAARAAERGRRVLLLEKNAKPGVKILMSGGTRCNLTHAVDASEIVAAFGRQGPFLHSALAALSPDDVVALFEAEGVATKIEPGGKVFPASDRAFDVLSALRRRLERSGATLILREPVLDLLRTGEEDGFSIVTPQRRLTATKVVLTTGGQSYPGCGTTGDGYPWASRFGHTIISPRPSLVPVKIHSPWAKSLRGVTISDARVRVLEGDTIVAKSDVTDVLRAERRGSLLFAHFGLTGPAVMDVSRVVSSHPTPGRLFLECDFVPDVRADVFEKQMAEAAVRQGKKQVATLFAEWLPRRLSDALLAEAGLPAIRLCAELSRAERARIVRAIKSTRLPVTGTLGFEKAEVTAGGVTLTEVDSSTMQSKLVPDLYFAGEILDLDGPIGGYNFQAAFSTGWLAGEEV
ncbi:MAG: BaiN/RdsA family NAD(P)/FAD-dependent oxidoreductase, partial [Pirellulaceae bacterium]